MSTIADALQSGIEHHRAGRLRQAEMMYRRVLELHPRHARAGHLIGLLAYQVGRTEEAIEYINEAIRIDRFNAVFHADLAEIYQAVGRIPEAIAACERALAIDPEMAAVHNCLGQLHQAQQDSSKALASFREAVTFDPKSAAANANLGGALRASGDPSGAQAAYERAVQLGPKQADNYLGLGLSLYDQGRVLDAIACYEKAIRLKPDLINARYHCALARMALGDFANGWPDFEFRHQIPQLVRRRYPLPVWSPAEPQSRPVLIHAEQSLGDTVQFVRYVPLVEKLGVRAVLDVQEELVPLLAQSGFKNLVCDGVVPAECASQLPLLSLPLLLGTALESIPAAVPYLSARDDLVEAWRAKLAALVGLKVGINWHDRRLDDGDRARSIPLRCFEPLANVAGVQLVSLQKGEGSEQLAEVAGQFTVHDLGTDFDESAGAFMDTAAVIRNLDLVITCDSAIAHVAGALGAPVWVALPLGADWRWMRSRADSPWYPTMQLFRQKTWGAWADVFALLAESLAALAAKPAAQP